jgi:hypothetical protein
LFTIGVLLDQATNSPIRFGRFRHLCGFGGDWQKRRVMATADGGRMQRLGADAFPQEIKA